MRALIQRVKSASVTVEGAQVSEIGEGLLVLVGITHTDGQQQVESLAKKILALRVFPGTGGDMDEALGEREILCVSQFTLYGDTSRGNRPSWGSAAPGDLAKPLWEEFCDRLDAKRGVFGAMMDVELVNDGPVTILLEADVRDR
jgi:D-tyrosyl-tRNA(Tyr) deacylase